MRVELTMPNLPRHITKGKTLTLKNGHFEYLGRFIDCSMLANILFYESNN